MDICLCIHIPIHFGIYKWISEFNYSLIFSIFYANTFSWGFILLANPSNYLYFHNYSFMYQFLFFSLIDYLPLYLFIYCSSQFIYLLIHFLHTHSTSWLVRLFLIKSYKYDVTYSCSSIKYVSVTGVLIRKYMNSIAIS